METMVVEEVDKKEHTNETFSELCFVDKRNSRNCTIFCPTFVQFRVREFLHLKQKITGHGHKG